MGMAPTIYRWDDTGAPSNPASTTRPDQANYLADVLIACLVNGYGEKAAAGWAVFDHVLATTSGNGRLVLQNGAQTGYAELILDRTYGTFGGSGVGTGWNGALLGDCGHRVTCNDWMRVLADTRWMVIANDAGAYLLLWREPTGLTGRDLSDYNLVACYVGSLMDWGVGLDPRAAPNFLLYTRYDGNSMSSYGKDGYGTASLIQPDGAVSANQQINDFAAVVGHGSYTYFYLQNVPDLPLCPVYIDHDNNGFARLPGWLSAISRVSISVVERLRDVEGHWTGDLITYQGKSCVLVANYDRLGLISLHEDDWP